MRLFCWNVNSLVPTVRNVNLKYGSLAAFFAHLDADIVCMQEVKLPDSKLTKELVIVEGYQSYWACSQNKTGYSGVTTWVREGWAASAAEADPFSCEGCDKEGRAVVTDHGTFVLFNLYVPNAGDRPARARLPAKLSFLAALKDRVDDLLGAGRQVVLVGDFNIATEKRDVHDALSWDTMYHPSELQALQALMGPEGSNCRDTWRVLHPQTDGVYTVWNEKTSARAFNVGLRIDYALVSSGLLDKVTSSEVLLELPPKWSDHAPLLLELNLPAPYTAAAAANGQAAAEQSDQQRQQQRPPECAMWQALVRRFQDPSQRSIAAMFRAAGKPKPAAEQAKGAAAPPAASAASTAAAAASGADSVSKPAAAAATARAAGASGSVAAAAAPAAAATAPAGRAGNAAAVSQQLGGQGSAAKEASTDIPTLAVTAAGEASDPLLGDAQQVAQQPGQQQQRSSQPSQQQQQEKQPPQVQQQPQQQQRGRGQGVAGSAKSTGRQAAGKRKAGSNDDTAAVKGPKQAKLQSFFARAEHQTVADTE